MTDLATVDPTEALERAADPGEFVVMALERGKTWLTEALAHGDLNALVTAKGYAETLRVATMQKQLGKDAELAAQELVRRAERCIGLGIRAGQEAGVIRRRGERVVNRNQHMAAAPQEPENSKSSPNEYFSNHEEQSDAYRMTDDVSDDQFETAIAEARAEGSLARANVIRKISPEKAPAATERSEWHYRKRHIDVERIIEETVLMLSGLAIGLNQIEDYSSLDTEKRLQWLEALREPLSAINRMVKGLRN